MGMWWLCWNFYAVGPPAQPKMPSLLMNFRLSMGWMHSIVFPLAPSLRYHQLTQTLLECAMAEWCRKIQVKMWSHRHTSFFHQQWITSFFALKVRSVSMHLQKIYIYIYCLTSLDGFHWGRYLVSPPFTSPAAADELKGFFDSGSLSWAFLDHSRWKSCNTNQPRNSVVQQN